MVRAHLLPLQESLTASSNNKEEIKGKTVEVPAPVFLATEIWLASKVIAPVTPAEKAWVDDGNVLFRWRIAQEKDALSDPPGLLEGIRSFVRSDGVAAVATFYKRYGPFNFTTSASTAGRIWRRSIAISARNRRDFLGQESLEWVRFFAQRVSFLYEVGLALNLRGTHSRRAARLREIWPTPEAIAETFNRAVEASWPVVPEWKQTPSDDTDVVTRARNYAQHEISGFIAGPGRPGLSVELVFDKGKQGQQILRPRTRCPTLFQAAGLALVWHFQRAFDVRSCKCGCGRWIHYNAGPGRPREFYEERCKWRFAKAG